MIDGRVTTALDFGTPAGQLASALESVLGAPRETVEVRWAARSYPLKLVRCLEAPRIGEGPDASRPMIPLIVGFADGPLGPNPLTLLAPDDFEVRGS